MKAEIVGFFSPDAESLEHFEADAATPFALWLEVLARPEGGRGEEIFGLLVCSRGWLLDRRPVDARWLATSQLPAFHQNMLVVESYDWATIRRLIEAKVAEIDSPTWREVAERMSEFARWEFAGMLGPEN